MHSRKLISQDTRKVRAPLAGNVFENMLHANFLAVKKSITADFGCLTFTFYLLIMFASCSPGSDNNKVVIDEDSSAISLYDIPAAAELDPVEKNRLAQQAESWYNTALLPKGFNGAILLAKGGNILYENYQGYADIGSGDSITPNAALHIASVTKTFTAMAILKLQEEGKLQITDVVSKYLQGFNYDSVTILDLLSHRSGLPNYLYFMDKLWPDKEKRISNGDVLHYLITKKGELKDISQPDSHFSYSNTNYALLALIIEKVSGISYPKYIRQKIFLPAGMNDSYVYQPKDSLRATPNYDWRGSPITQNFLDNVYGDKNIYSTVRDLLQWDRVLKTPLFLSAQSLAQAYTGYSNERAGIKNYGLGWRMNVYPDGKKIVFHNGWWHGNTAAFIRLLQEDVTIIALSNRYSRGTYSVKILANLFYPYYENVPEEEGETSDTTSSVHSKKDTISSK